MVLELGYGFESLEHHASRDIIRVCNNATSQELMAQEINPRIDAYALLQVLSQDGVGIGVILNHMKDNQLVLIQSQLVIRQDVFCLVPNTFQDYKGVIIRAFWKLSNSRMAIEEEFWSSKERHERGVSQGHDHIVELSRCMGYSFLGNLGQATRKLLGS